jgi:colanic acid/amylovoran biosynthesis glycosyltransferase
VRIAILTGALPSTTFIDLLINGIAERGHTPIVIGKKTGKFKYHKKVETTLIPKSKFGQLIFILSLMHKIFQTDPAFFLL